MSWSIRDITLESRLLLGTARYPSPEVLVDSINASKADIITVSLRRESAQTNQGSRFWDILGDSHKRILPNTAGCHSVKEAVTTAHLARDLFDTNWIKLEVIGNDETLQPDTIKTVEAARILCSEGFEVFPYTTEDLVIAERLVEAGCQVIMPWASPIGTGQGITNTDALVRMRHHFKEQILIVDAGIGKPSHALQAMELGFDAVLLNTAVAKAQNPIQMARAFQLAVTAGRLAYESGLMRKRDNAVPSTPTIGMPFWHEEL